MEIAENQIHDSRWKILFHRDDRSEVAFSENAVFVLPGAKGERQFATLIDKITFFQTTVILCDVTYPILSAEHLHMEVNDITRLRSRKFLSSIGGNFGNK